jgi:hypothetical protein
MAPRTREDAATDPEARAQVTRDTDEKTDPHTLAHLPDASGSHDVKTEPGGFIISHDPIEQDPRYLAVIGEVDAEVQRLVSLERQAHPEIKIGWAHSEWEHKKRLLKERHDIDWKSPIELDPGMQMD